MSAMPGRGVFWVLATICYLPVALVRHLLNR